MRKIFFWLHLTAGVTAGLAILIMCVTGATLAFEKQIVAWLEPSGVRVVAPPDGAAHLPVAAILAKFQEQNEATPSAVTLHAERDAPMDVGAGRAGTFYVNPYTGEILGKGPALGPGQPVSKTRAFFASVENWHRWLAGTGTYREWGKSINDAGNLIFFGIVLSGFYLWLPRKFSWAFLKPVVLFRGGLKGKARDWNWHNVIGIWAWAPLVLIVGSSVIMSYPWASNLLYTMTGSPLPPQFGAKGGPPKGAPKGGEKGGPGAAKGGPGIPGFGFGGGAPANWDGIDEAFAKAERQVSDWRTIRVQGSPNANAPLSFAIDRGDGTQPQLRATLTVRRDGEVEKWADFSSNNAGQQLRLLSRYAHTGEVLGVWGQAIAGLATAGGAVMVYTGIALAFRRLLAWRKRKREPLAVAA